MSKKILIMDKRKSVILSTLLGLVLPFGNIWGPFLVRCDRKEQRKYRRSIVWSELAITVVSFIIGVGVIVVWMKDIVQMNDPKPINSMILMCLFFGFSGLVVLFALGNILFLHLKRE